jgi:DNA-binding NarL/FixJ family response regulator
MAAHQLIKFNEPPLRQRRMLDLRQQVYTLWMRGLSTPKIADELGCSTGTVDKHKRAIREDWESWHIQDSEVSA